MNSPTQKITTPLAKAEIELKDWITGAEAEYIEEALMSGVDIKPDLANKTANFGKFNVGAINDQVHREIEKFVVSVNGETKDVLKAITSLPEEDYDFVKDTISDKRGRGDQGKKKDGQDGQ